MDTRHPTVIPMMGDQSRHVGGARITIPATTTRVTRAATGAAACGDPSGTTLSESNTIGITVAAISMITVPVTVGVKMRRSNERRAAKRNWKSDDMTIRLAIVAGPTSLSAATQTAMKAPDVPISSTCPDPNRPTRTA